MLPQRAAHDIVAEYLKGNTKSHLSCSLNIFRLSMHFSVSKPIPVKYAMSLLGYNAGPVGLPLTEMEDAHKALLADEMRKAGLI